MRSSDALKAFLDREGGYEICTALLPERQTRQDLLELIAVSPRTIDRRLTEAQDLSLIQREPTTGTELLFSLNQDELPDEHLVICKAILDHHAATDTHSETLDPAEIDLHRSNLNRGRGEETHSEPRLVHANVAGGASTFIRR
ncbi:hypothetical protein ACFQGT_14530 [Natrialbaceae archaeon GCM10025810]|uniref:hypothetical protein n=1 Tax=Halovalidus salilacus TaxID=3075124 RepID=UPI003617E67D